MTKYLLVKGCAGIGNRLYTVSRAIEIAAQQQRTLVVDWKDGQFAPEGINAFHHFFEIVDFPHQESIPPAEGLTVYPPILKSKLDAPVYKHFQIAEPPGKFLERIPLALLPGVKLKMLHGYWISNKVKQAASYAGFIRNMFRRDVFPFGEHSYRKKKENILVYVEFSPGFRENLFLKHIKLKQEYLGKAVRFYDANLGKARTLGVHIRATDKQPPKKTDFLVDHLKSNYKDHTLFLATDNEAVEKRFRKEFGECLVVYPKFLPETGGNGLHQYALYKQDEKMMLQMTEESLMDMWILSMCGKLYYQGNSSFSKVAVALHRNKSDCRDWIKL